MNKSAAQRFLSHWFVPVGKFKMDNNSEKPDLKMENSEKADLDSGNNEVAKASPEDTKISQR